MARRSRQAAVAADANAGDVGTLDSAVGQVLDQAATEFDPVKLEQELAAGRQNGQADQPTTAVETTSVNGEELSREGERSHAAAVGRKQYTPPPDPFGFENIAGDGNRVHLLKSEGHEAWVIRFEKPPNEMEGYSRENPHPVIKMLKEEGYRWGFDEGDGKGGWGKRWEGDPYGQDHIEARRVLKRAAEMVGAEVSQGQGLSA